MCNALTLVKAPEKNSFMIINLCMLENPKMVLQANSEDPDEMLQGVAFHQGGLNCLLG